jgi:hypothetical protein
MRKLILAVASLLALGLSASPASAFWMHHRLQPQYVQGGFVSPQGVSAQGIPPWLISSLVSGFLGGIPNFPGFQIGGGGQPGGSLASTPVPADVAARLNDVDSKLSDGLTRARKLVPDELKGRPK